MKAAEAALATGERGALEALLRKEGIYSSHLSAWRQQLASSGTAGLAARTPGRSTRLDAAARALLAAKKENDALKHKEAKRAMAAGDDVFLAPISHSAAISPDPHAASIGAAARDADHAAGQRVVHFGRRTEVGVDRDTANALRAVGIGEAEVAPGSNSLLIFVDHFMSASDDSRKDRRPGRRYLVRKDLSTGGQDRTDLHEHELDRLGPSYCVIWMPGVKQEAMPVTEQFATEYVHQKE